MNNAIVLQELEDKLDSINSSLTSKIDTINANTASTKTTVDNIYAKVDTEVTAIVNNTNVNNSANANGNLSQKLSWIGNVLIGSTNSTGGSSTSGTVMAKLNALLGATRSFNVKTQSVEFRTSSNNDNLLNISGTGYIYFISLPTYEFDITINNGTPFKLYGAVSTQGTYSIVWRGTNVIPFANKFHMEFHDTETNGEYVSFTAIIVTFA